VSAQTVTLNLLVLCVSTLLAPCFGYSWPMSSCYSLETCLSIGSLSPNSPFAYFFVSHSRSVCCSVLVHSCHTASTFPYETVSHCCDIVRVEFLLISAFVTLSTIQQSSPFHLPLISLECLPSTWTTMYGCCWLVNGYRHSKDRTALIFRVKQL